MKKSEIKKYNEEAKKKLDQLLESLSNPLESGYIDDDTEELLQVLREENINSWYRITQSNMKILLELKKKGLLSGEKNQSRIISENLEAIGWGNAKEESDIDEGKLNPNSPIYILKELYEIDSMILKRREALLKGIIKESDNRDDENKVPFLDEGSGISGLYLVSNENKEQVMSDISEIGVLSEQYQKIILNLQESSQIFKRKEFCGQFIKEIIIEAIALGYTSGINANTTQTLRKMKGCNSDQGEM